MSQLGFKRFDNPRTKPITVPELLKRMSSRQKELVLEGFILEKPPGQWAAYVAETYPQEVETDETLNDIPIRAIRTLYHEIKGIQAYAEELMLGEEPPTTSVALKSLVVAEYAEKFNENQVTAILTAMIKWCKEDGSGTWTYYKTEIIK